MEFVIKNIATWNVDDIYYLQVSELKKLSNSFYSKLMLVREPLTYSVSQTEINGCDMQVEIILFPDKIEKEITVNVCVDGMSEYYLLADPDNNDTHFIVNIDKDLNNFGGSKIDSYFFQINELKKLSYDFYEKLVYGGETLGYHFKNTKSEKRITKVELTASFIDPDKTIDVKVGFNIKWSRSLKDNVGDYYNFTIDKNNKILNLH